MGNKIFLYGALHDDMGRGYPAMYYMMKYAGDIPAHVLHEMGQGYPCHVLHDTGFSL